MTQEMGIGKLGSPNALYVRKYRWTLESDIMHAFLSDPKSNKKLEKHLVKSIKIDHFRKIIKISVYEIAYPDDEEISVHGWIDKMKSRSFRKNQILLFKTFDGLGNQIYEYSFSGLKITGIQQDFDYASSDISHLDFVIKYKNMNRLSLIQA